jgi:hypothetical protein
VAWGVGVGCGGPQRAMDVAVAVACPDIRVAFRLEPSMPIFFVAVWCGEQCVWSQVCACGRGVPRLLRARLLLHRQRMAVVPLVAVRGALPALVLLSDLRLCRDYSPSTLVWCARTNTLHARHTHARTSHAWVSWPPLWSRRG